MADIWADELTDTASQKFRGSGHDTNMAFFFINYVIERHREALLWSYLVARIDEDEDGWIDEVEKLDLFNFLAIHPGNQLHTSDNSIAVSTPLRDVDYGHYFQQAGLSVPLQTNYTFGSSNGYAYVDGRYTPWGHSDWPDFTKTQSIPFCSIDSHCLGLQPEEAVDLFKRVTFEHRKCGDCLIVALLHLSGKTGFGAFLPPSRQDDPPLTISNRTVTVLPKSKNWRDVDFSLHTITGHLEQSDESYQSFCIRLIHRYAYVIGDSALHFIRIGTTKQLEGQIEIIENNPKALLVLNDDVSLHIGFGYRWLTYDRIPDRRIFKYHKQFAARLASQGMAASHAMGKVGLLVMKISALRYSDHSRLLGSYAILGVCSGITI